MCTIPFYVCDHTDVSFGVGSICTAPSTQHYSLLHKHFFNEKCSFKNQKTVKKHTQKMEVSPGRRCSGRQPTTARRRRRRSEANETAKTAESPANRVHAGLLLSWTYSHPPLPPPPMPRVGSTLTHSLISLSLAPLFSTFETQWSFEKRKHEMTLTHDIYPPFFWALAVAQMLSTETFSNRNTLCISQLLTLPLYISALQSASSLLFSCWLFL